MLRKFLTLGSVVCPDRSTTCNTGYTCCIMLSGRYGCCPYSNAVCCSDYIHCCPYDYVCKMPYSCSPRLKYEEHPLVKVKDVTPKDTRKENFLLALYNDVNSVICPGGKSSCSTGNTCCKLPNGEYSCCTFPNAGCCSDGVHCCPEGFVCDIEKKKCLKELKEIPIGLKIRSKPISPLLASYLKEQVETPKKPAIVNCSHGRYFCLDGETCCEISAGVYGCCPKPHAVCCNDHIHCCPQGTSCDLLHLNCLRSNGKTVQMLTKHAASIHKQDLNGYDLVQCDNKSYCESGSTCCKLKSGKYGCCHLLKAVCCKDGVHCCPHGNVCAKTGCLHGNNEIVAWSKKIPAKQLTICPGGDTSCPDSWTCCLLLSGDYGCCPVRDGVCCDDRIHCCPNGYTCDEGERIQLNL